MPSYMDKQWRGMLRQLEGRDAPVELSRRDADSDAPLISYRTRLFGVRDDGCIIVERPTQGLDEPSFGKGDDIELLLMQNSERLIATCTIRDTFIKQINPRTRVSSFLLSPGRRPQRDQRRSFYRVGVAAIDLPPAVLRAAEGEDPLSFKARIVNISAGGLGVSVRAKHKTLGQIKRTPSLWCEASLTEQDAIAGPVKIRHVSALGDDGLYLGLAFELEDEAEAKRLEDNLSRLCFEFQRRALKRRRA